MTFNAKIENLEIRGKEIKTGKAGDYALVRLDAPSGERLEFIDRDADRFDYYERGKLCDLTIKVTNTPKYTNFVITNMEYRE